MTAKTVVLHVILAWVFAGCAVSRTGGGVRGSSERQEVNPNGSAATPTCSPHGLGVPAGTISAALPHGEALSEVLWKIEDPSGLMLLATRVRDTQTNEQRYRIDAVTREKIGFGRVHHEYLSASGSVALASATDIDGDGVFDPVVVWEGGISVFFSRLMSIRSVEYSKQLVLQDACWMPADDGVILVLAGRSPSGEGCMTQAYVGAASTTAAHYLPERQGTWRREDLPSDYTRIAGEERLFGTCPSHGLFVVPRQAKEGEMLDVFRLSELALTPATTPDAPPLCLLD